MYIFEIQRTFIANGFTEIDYTRINHFIGYGDTRFERLFTNGKIHIFIYWKYNDKDEVCLMLCEIKSNSEYIKELFEIFTENDNSVKINNLEELNKTLKSII